MIFQLRASPRDRSQNRLGSVYAATRIGRPPLVPSKIGASDQSLRSSFEQGVIAIESVSLDETGTPALFTAGGVNAAKLKLV